MATFLRKSCLYAWFTMNAFQEMQSVYIFPSFGFAGLKVPKDPIIQNLLNIGSNCISSLQLLTFFFYF